jgi:Domain of unknown function (DUF4440)
MKKYLTYSLASFFAMTVVGLAGAGADTSAIKEKETAAWQAFKGKDAAGFQKVVDKDFVGVYDVGVSDMAKELSDMKKWDMKSFAISEFKAFSDEKDVIVTAYVVKVEGTYDGKDASGTMNAGSVWKKEGKDWLAIFHTNVKQAAAAK